jgi:hypothetical protein
LASLHTKKSALLLKTNRRLKKSFSFFLYYELLLELELACTIWNKRLAIDSLVAEMRK